MKKILTSTWFAAVVGVVAFILTMLLLWKPEPPAEPVPTGTNEVADAQAPAAEPPVDELTEKQIVAPPPPTPAVITDVAEPGSLTFNNPEVSKLRDELLREKAELLRRENELNQIASRLALEKEHIGMITQQMMLAKASLQQALTNQVVVYEQAEERRLQDLARVYTNMAPSSAVVILDKMAVDDVARILQYMDEQFKAAILSNFATNTNAASSPLKATEISEKLRRLVLPPQLPGFQR